MRRPGLLLACLVASAVSASALQAKEAKVTLATTQPVVSSGCVLLHNKQLRFSTQHVSGAVAWGAHTESATTVSNFGKLRVVTSSDHSDLLQMRAAGFLEGWLTAERIWDHWTNVHSYFANQLYPGVDFSDAATWLSEQEHWLREQVASRSKDDPQWRAVGLVMSQFDGLVEGYQARAAQSPRRGAQGAPEVGLMERMDLMFLNNNGELYDIIDRLQADKERLMQADQQRQAHAATEGVRQRTIGPEDVYSIISMRGRCSALIKVLPDLSDVFIGHSTWDSFTNALRIFKHYQFNLNDPDVRSRQLSFSSYPGELFSDDDLYISDTKLVMVETTLHIFQPQLLDSLSTTTVPSWYRVRMAFLRASSGEEWVRYFSLHNSGTYNNQYMVVDLNRLVPSQELQSGFLWVVEQIPGLVSAIDATQVLSYAYWPSYNVPFFEQIYNATGYPDMIQKMQDEDPAKYEGQIRWLKYQIAPRAAMYRRDQGKVRSVDDLKQLMRYNNWRSDPFSAGHPAYSVCGRYDLLETDEAHPTGCYDSKVTSYQLALNMEAEVVNGPPVTADKVPFSWSGRWADPQYVHRGHPTTFNYSFERMTSGDSDLKLPVDASGRWL